MKNCNCVVKLPFGEDLSTPQRTPQLGYQPDNIRQGFTGYLDDEESGLEFAEARMYATSHGRFTSPDPLLSSGNIAAPESWNRYAYSFNNPLRFTDPLGLYVWSASLGGSATDEDLLKRKGGQAIVDQRNQFRNGLAEAAKAATSDTLTAKEQAKIARGVAVYGAEGVKNGVSIFSKEGPGSGATQVAGVVGAKTSENPTGQIIRVSFDPSLFSDDGFAEIIAHEGSHAADGSEWVASGFAKSKNPSIYQTELDAYTVAALVAQARGKDTLTYRFDAIIKPNTPSLIGKVDFWNSGWDAVDRAKLRQENIKRYLENNKSYSERLTKSTFLKGSKF